MKRILVALVAALTSLTAFATVPVSAETNSDVYVVHGIPGLTVDVYVNGDLTLDGFEPKDVAGPLSLPAGDYDIDIFAAADNPPSDIADRVDAAAIDVTAAVPGGANIDVVAHLDADGTPVVTPFVNDISLIKGSIDGRVSIRHAAQAPAVDIILGGAPVTGLTNLANGKSADIELPTGSYATGIAAAGSTDVLVPAPVALVPGQSVKVYAIGSLGSTFDLLVLSDAGFNLGEEYRGSTGKAAFTARVYLAALGRNPDAPGFAYWLDRLENESLGYQRMIEFFVNSPEFKERFADVQTDEDYVDLAYQHVFGRAADAGGKAYWLNRLDEGSVTRAGLILFFADSPEFRGYTGTN